MSRYGIIFKTILLWLLLTASVDAADHYFTGLPYDANGWTDLQAVVQAPDQYTTSRIVYVSTSGNDSTGEHYAIGDAEIGTNPFSPSGTVAPYATFASAYAQLRTGYADILLLKRGDTWTDVPTITLTKSGASNTARLIIGAYGSSGGRPILASAGQLFSVNSGTPSNIIISDIEMYPHDRQATEDPDGIRWVGGGSNILIEGCYIHDYRYNLNFNDLSTSYATSGISLRRNIIVDAWSAEDIALGIYTAFQGSFLIEENVWDHNGWSAAQSDPQDVRSRNLYLDYYLDPNMTVRGNIDARSSAEGTQMRHGGLYEYNLSLQNSAAVGFGHAQATYNSTGKIRKNVVLDGRDINGSPRGTGILIGNRIVNVEVDDNIIAHQVSATAATGIEVTNETDMTYQETEENVYVTNPIFTNNIVYDWKAITEAWSTGVSIGQAAIGITFQNNIIEEPGNVRLLNYTIGTQHSGPDDTWVFSGNTYYSASSSSPFFGSDVGDMTFAEWSSAAGESGSSMGQATFTDPDRTIETYATAQGLNPTDYEDGLAKFLTQARAQSRFNWDTDYTAYAVINYIRAGFDRGAVGPDYTTLPDPPSGAVHLLLLSDGLFHSPAD